MTTNRVNVPQNDIIQWRPGAVELDLELGTGGPPSVRRLVSVGDPGTSDGQSVV